MDHQWLVAEMEWTDLMYSGKKKETQVKRGAKIQAPSAYELYS